MTKNQKAYAVALRVVAVTMSASIAMCVVMTDSNEEREPWEFVPVQSK